MELVAELQVIERVGLPADFPTQPGFPEGSYRKFVVAVKSFFLGLMVFEINPLPAHPGLYLHLGMVALLMIVFPVSKLLHAPGVFFSPTRNQVDNPRETRHLAPWAATLGTKN